MHAPRFIGRSGRQAFARRAGYLFAAALAAALIVPAAAASAAEGATTIVVEPDPAVIPVTVLPAGGASGARTMPVGAFCPAPQADPLREASTFGLTALLMWAFVRRREKRAAA